MNLRIQNHNALRRNRKLKMQDGRNVHFIITAIKIACPVCIIFAVAILKVLLNSKTENLNRIVTQSKREVYSLERETANLRIMVEQHRGKYIFRQVKRFHLCLRYPHPEQIRKIEVIAQTRVPEKQIKAKPLLVSQR